VSDICRLKRKQKAFAWLLLSLLLFFLLAICAAFVRAETTYNMNETELTRLQQICNQLDQLNSQLSAQLTNSKASLQELTQQLNSYRTQISDLAIQLQNLQQESNLLKEQLLTVQNSLQSAEESFKEYETKVNAQIKKLVWQRNLAVLAGILIAIFK
jgi:chromosome segregation ATPase